MELDKDEVATELRPYSVDRKCSACGEGRMRRDATGIAIATMPMLYPHTCDKCGHHANYEKCYPDMRFEPVKYFDGSPRPQFEWPTLEQDWEQKP